MNKPFPGSSFGSNPAVSAEVTNKLAYSLQESNADLDAISAKLRVQGLLEDTPAIRTNILLEALATSLPKEDEAGKKVCYVMHLIALHQQEDHLWQVAYDSRLGVFAMFPVGNLSGEDHIVQQEPIHRQAYDWVIYQSDHFGFNLASQLYRAPSEEEKVYLIAYQYDVGMFKQALSSVPIAPAETSAVAPRKVFPYSLHEGWLWEGEFDGETFIDVPASIPPSLVVAADKHRQKRLLNTYAVEQILSQITAPLPVGKHRLLNLPTRITHFPVELGITKEQDDTVPQGFPDPGAKVSYSSIPAKEAITASLLNGIKEGHDSIFLVIREERNQEAQVYGWKCDKDGLHPLSPTLALQSLRSYGPLEGKESFISPHDITTPEELLMTTLST